MMKRFLYLTILLGGILFCTGCRSVKSVVVEIQKPAQILLPKTINNIGIINNAVPQPDTWGHSEAVYSGGKRLEEPITLASDSNIVFLTETLFNNLISLDHFNNVSLYEFPLRNDLSFSEEEHPIDSAMIKEISQITNSDALISIDRFLINTTTRKEPYDIETNLKVLDLKVDVRFRIFSKEGKQISSPFYLTDSIYWLGVYRNETLISESAVPTREEAIKEGAEYMAEKIANAFVHTWREVPRIYYGDVKEANKKAETNDWANALRLWEEAYNKEQKPKKKARLANNIALAYEISDDIKNALKWAQISYDLFVETAENSIDQQYVEAAQYYKDTLMERYQEFRLLDLRNKEE